VQSVTPSCRCYCGFLSDTPPAPGWIQENVLAEFEAFTSAPLLAAACNNPLDTCSALTNYVPWRQVSLRTSSLIILYGSRLLMFERSF
jgi:hypothetical protein